jgi:hypothetical protein
MIKLIELFHKIGSRTPLWTQGQGSNISRKDDDVLYIKPTGFRLDEVQVLSQLAQVQLSLFHQALNEIKNKVNSSELECESLYSEANCESLYSEASCESLYSEAIKKSAILSENSNRASMEAGFHALLPKKYVLHFHSLPGLLLAEFYFLHQEKLKSFLDEEETFLKNKKIQFVPYKRPGLNLSLALLSDCDWFFLKNHGVILQFDDSQEFESYKLFEDRFTLWLNAQLKIDLSQIVREVKQEKVAKGNLKYYFPDVAIFDEQLKNLGKLTNDRNLQENWQAICVLQRALPELSELTKEEIGKIKSLPTEIARMKNIKGIV